MTTHKYTLLFICVLQSLIFIVAFRTPIASRISQRNSILSLRLNSRNPWKAGDAQPLPFESKTYKSYDPNELKAAGGLYPLLISAIIPRPIALVSSVSKDGVLNCAPFAYFNVVSHDPPLVIIGCCNNMRQFVINTISDWYLESADHTGEAFPPEVNEMQMAAMTNLPSHLITPPRVGNSAIQFECKTHTLLPILNDAQDHSLTLIIGKIEKIHVHEEVLTTETKDTMNPLIDYQKLQPIGRLGEGKYTRIEKDIDLHPCTETD